MPRVWNQADSYRDRRGEESFSFLCSFSSGDVFAL